MIDILSYTFIQHAILAGILVSISAGIIGPLIVTNRISFLAGGIAHSSYGGIGIALYLGIPILFGATIFAVITAIIIAYLTLQNRERIDAVIGIMWSAGMALGIILIDLTPGYNVDLMSFLFGSIIAVSLNDIYYMIVLDIVIVALVTYYYREFLAISYDSEFAQLRGINVKFFYTLMLVLAALTVVAAIQVVGLILVIALLTIPTYIAENYANRLSTMMILSVIFAAVFTLSGLTLSYMYDLSSGASIIVVSIFGLIISKIIKKKK
ncbi:MAG: metal ABC transporter permease [Arcobacteraceae bacterium]|nr:metal ABC transporter permease [Arcobacteraceae bacterium]